MILSSRLTMPSKKNWKGKVMLMATKKNPEYWYMLVMTHDGPRFITDYSWSDKTAHWHKDKKPIQLDKNWVRDMFVGLTWNGHTCFPVCSPIELDRQPYRYNLGHFEWVSDIKKEGDDDGKN